MVISGGYIGLEVAEAVRSLGLSATVVDRSKTPATTLDPDVGERIAEALRGLDIDLEVARTGMSERECREAGYSFVTGAVDSSASTSWRPRSGRR